MVAPDPLRSKCGNHRENPPVLIMASLDTITQCLEQSLLPQHARQAESQLREIETTPGFSVSLLGVVSLAQVDALVRLAGALFFKNLIKRKWLLSDGETYQLPESDVAQIKREIIPMLVQLPVQLQRQVGQAITLIAESDFPHRWDSLILELVGQLSPHNFVHNRAVLEVMHLIFKKWRPLFRSDELFKEIKLVLETFAPTFLQLFNALDELIDQNLGNGEQLTVLLENLLVMMQLYYDLNCQDLPEFFEDHMQELMTYVLKYLEFSSPTITDDDEDDDVDILIKVKTAIIELLSLYVNRYAEDFTRFIEVFITKVWHTVSLASSQSKYDLLVVKLLGFMSSVIKIPTYQHLFNKEEAFDEIIQKIILPNIAFRDRDEEQFEDEPIQFVRLDLEGLEFESRRKSATDFLRELKEVNTQMITSKVMTYVNNFLASLADNWRNKDIAIYLFTSLATKGLITNAGVTTVVVDVVGFFTQNIVQDLSQSTTHPILRMDAIKYIYVFRNQLTKEQLVEVIRMMVQLLDPNQLAAIYTYAAVTLEKLLGMSDFQSQTPIFNKEDMADVHLQLLTKLFDLLAKFHSQPERLADNEFVMKCIMRVLLVTEDALTNRSMVMTQLMSILEVISKNPSNPKFTHYVFELIGILIKFAGESEVPDFVNNLVPRLLPVLGEDIQEFVPYIFQILAYILERLPLLAGLPEVYLGLVKPLMSPSVWEFKGNIPGITRLLVAIIQQDHSVCDDASTIQAVLGVFQRLVSSKQNDSYGLDLLQTVLLFVNPQSYMQYLRDVGILLMTRLQNLRTEKFVKRLVLFLMVLASTPLSQDDIPNKQSISGSFIVQFFDNAQPGVFERIAKVFIVPTVLLFANLQDKKIGNIGLAQLVLAPEISEELCLAATQLLGENMIAYEGIQRGPAVGMAVANNAPLNELDLEVLAFGSNFSRIVLIQSKTYDPVAHITNNDLTAIERVVCLSIKQVRPLVALALLPEIKERVQRMG